MQGALAAAQVAKRVAIADLLADGSRFSRFVRSEDGSDKRRATEYQASHKKPDSAIAWSHWRILWEGEMEILRLPTTLHYCFEEWVNVQVPNRKPFSSH